MINILRFIAWLIILMCIGWPVGFMAAHVYVLYLPFTVCCGRRQDLERTLFSGIEFPKRCAQEMMKC